MAGVIKGVLSEELENSLHMKKGYEENLKRLPKGCLAKRKIRGHEYFYLVKREGRKIKYAYLGKISQEKKEEYEKAKVLRAKYRKLLSQAKKQIRFLRSSLRGKQAV